MQWLRRGQRWIGTLLVIGLLTGCAATSERRSTGEVIDDTTITTKVKANLLADPVVSLRLRSVSRRPGCSKPHWHREQHWRTGTSHSCRARDRWGAAVDARNLYVKQ